MATCGLHGIIGNKGAGKSMLMVKTVAKTLLSTARNVVTNLPIKYAEFLAYLQERDASFTGAQLERRLTIVTDVKEIRRFWLHRGNGWCLLDVPDDRWDVGIVTDYTVAYRWLPTTDQSKRKKVCDLTKDEAERYVQSGDLEMCDFSVLPAVQYVWDEMQNVYPSRAWAKTPPSLLWHLTQQRKVSDDILVASQRPKLMEVQFREMMDDWTFLTNWSKKRKWLFRLPKAMSWSLYDQLPAPGVRPMVSGHTTIDVTGIGECYDTSAGTNVLGGLLADTAEKGAGLHWSWFGVALVVGLLALWILPGKVLGFIGSKTRSTVRAMKPAETNTPAAPASLGAAAVGAVSSAVLPGVGFGSVPKPAPTRETAPPPLPRRTLTGIHTWWNMATCYFSDNTSVTSQDPRFGRLLKNGKNYAGAIVDGHTYWLGQPVDYGVTTEDRSGMAVSRAGQATVN